MHPVLHALELNKPEHDRRGGEIADAAAVGHEVAHDAHDGGGQDVAHQEKLGPVEDAGDVCGEGASVGEVVPGFWWVVVGGWRVLVGVGEGWWCGDRTCELGGVG